MLKSSQVWMTVGVLFLIGVFLFPLWRITLEAAQFPGGIHLNIWINKFSGNESSGDVVKNVNILNHYIGMQKIDPSAIPEFKYFPIIIYVMMGLGFLAAWVNKTYSYVTWFILMGILGVLGIYDFYLWMYDYGHNLDTSAPIRIEGMSYMPPLFGEKSLLNFYIKSYPQLGTLFLTLSILFSLIATWVRKKSIR